MKDKVIVTVVLALLDCGGDGGDIGYGGAEGDLGGNGVQEGPKAACIRPEDTTAGELEDAPVGEPQDLPYGGAGYATTIERLKPCKGQGGSDTKVHAAKYLCSRTSLCVPNSVEHVCIPTHLRI